MIAAAPALAWWWGEDDDTTTAKPNKQKMGIFINFENENEPYCELKFHTEEKDYKFQCRGSTETEYPPMKTVIPRKDKKHRFVNKADNKTMRWAIGPLDWQRKIFIHEGIAPEEGNTEDGSIVLNRWDMKRLYDSFLTHTVVAISYHW